MPNILILDEKNCDVQRHLGRPNTDFSVVDASGTGQLQANPLVASPRLYPGTPTPSTATMMGYNDLVVGTDNLLDQVASGITGKRTGEAG